MRRTLLRLLVLLLVVEAGLQLIDWLRWRRQVLSLDAPPVAGRVLCVGGETCFDPGVRSREDSWPVRAGSGLCEVRNHALPGMDSSELVMRLPEWLDAVRPEMVYVGIGDEDFARRSARPVAADRVPGRSLPFRPGFRLGELASTVAAALTGESGDAATELIGDWHRGDVAFSFTSDGVVRMQGLVSTWSVEGGELRVGVPNEEDLRLSWRVVDGKLELGAPVNLTLERGEPSGDVAGRARDALARGDLSEARWLVEVELAGGSPTAETAAVAVALAVLEGRADEARALTAALRRRFSANGSKEERRALIDALCAIGDHGAAFDLFSTDPEAWSFDRAGIRRLGTGLAETSYARPFAGLVSQRVTVDVPPEELAAFRFAAADALAVADPIRALDHAREGAEALGLSMRLDTSLWPAVIRRTDERTFAAAVASFDTEGRAVLTRVRAELLAADADTGAILRHNLALLVAIVRYYGAEIRLLDLSREPAAAGAHREVAERLAVPLVPIDPSAREASLRDDLRAIDAGKR